MIANPFIRVGLVWLLLLMVFQGKSQLAIALFGPGYTLVRHLVMAGLSTALVVPLIVMARRWLDAEPFGGLGLALDTRAVRPFLVGVLAWLGPFLAALAIGLLLGLVEIRPAAAWPAIATFIPLLVLLVFLLEALPEELAFRGYIQTNLLAALPPWQAVAVQALLFGTWGVAMWLIGSGGLDPMHASLFYVMGAVLGILRVMTGSVWTGIGFHLAFQTAAQLLLNVERGHFHVGGGFWLPVLVLGAIPFSLAIPIVEQFYRRKVAWGSMRA
jgi:membrane protease YdiL (CAAX protease family)